MHTCGIYSNNEVKNIRAQPIMIPVTLPDTPDFASLSWFTADQEKEAESNIADCYPHYDLIV